jgi:hypothetical protein
LRPSIFRDDDKREGYEQIGEPQRQHLISAVPRESAAVLAAA